MNASIRNEINAHLNPSMADGLSLDIAIIGAGVSGLYSGFRLATRGSSGGHAPAVQIFELGSRIGGRLESVVLPGMTISAELGGMRYMDAHEIVASLIEKVFRDELTSVVFPMGDPAKLYFYGRTQRCRQDAWTTAQAQGKKFITNYFLRPEFVGMDSDQIFNKIIYDVLSADPWFKDKYGTKIEFAPPYGYTFKLTAEDWDDVKPRVVYHFDGPYKGMLLNDIGFWNLIRDQAGDEAYEFVSVAGGYYSNTINWNAAEAFPYMVGDFSNAGTTYKTIEGGYDQIAYSLAKAYLAQPGSMIWSGNRLETFHKTPEGSSHRYQLNFFNQQSGRHWNVYANAIVLAVPRRSLELLDQSNFFFHSDTVGELQNNIDSVIMEPSFKLLMGFEEPWWREDFGAEAGESITDLPLRQCYYFGIDPTTRHSVFLSSYNDMRSVAFWQTLEPKSHVRCERFHPRPTRHATLAALEPLRGVQAPRVMVDEAMAQVREVHGPQPKPIPSPYVTYYKDWTQDPYGGGYHAWKAGAAVNRVMPYMRKPRQTEAIHICGEAYSDQQGWVEGALCVAERMLEEHFGLDRPEWLSKDYYLGW